MVYKYLIINVNNINNQLDGNYLSFSQAFNLLKKYDVYIFKYNSDKDILYLNYPLDNYNCSKINKISDDNKEEDVTTYSYIEVRLTNKFPSIRTGVLDII